MSNLLDLSALTFAGLALFGREDVDEVLRGRLEQRDELLERRLERREQHGAQLVFARHRRELIFDRLARREPNLR